MTNWLTYLLIGLDSGSSGPRTGEEEGTPNILVANCQSEIAAGSSSVNVGKRKGLN